MNLTSQNIGDLFKTWFQKSILTFSIIDFNDVSVFAEALKVFKSDYQRYFVSTDLDSEQLLSRIELVGILLYRVARVYFLNGNEVVAAKYSNLCRLISGFEIYYSAEIGSGLKINHGLGTVIGARSIIGDNCLIHQNVTLGDKDGGRPTIGNNVIVYAGAKLLGQIQIGNDAIIAANAVCFISVPENTIAVGIPSRIIKKN
jgi:serine O-acetyltransferase